MDRYCMFCDHYNEFSETCNRVAGDNSTDYQLDIDGTCQYWSGTQRHQYQQEWEKTFAVGQAFPMQGA